MNLTPYFERCIYKHTLEDDAVFAAWTEGLPIRKPTTPFDCGAHSVRSMRMAYEVCGRPANVLEIGFCLGRSATIWFGLGATTVTSIENSTRHETMEAAQIMSRKYGGRFRFLQGSSEKLMDWETPLHFGLMFIDGGHELEAVSNDIALGKILGIPYLLLDDFFPKWGVGVQPAIEQHGLIPLAIIGNQALCVTDENFK